MWSCHCRGETSDAKFPGLGNDTVEAVFRLLLLGATIEVHFKDKIELDDLGLTQDIIDNIQHRAKILFVENDTKLIKALQSGNRHF